MKRLSFIISFLFLISFSNNVEGQTRIDTLYYDFDHNVVRDASFAKEMIIIKHSDSHYLKQYERYRIVDKLLLQEGYCIGLDDSGKLLKEGMSRVYENGQLASTCMFKKNKKNGILTSYNEMGGIESDATFQDDIQSGPIRTYHPNGNLATVEYSVNFIREGYYKQFWPNGKLQMYGTFKNGLANGTFLLYDELGNLTETAYFINDIKQ